MREEEEEETFLSPSVCKSVSDHVWIRMKRIRQRERERKRENKPRYH